MHPWVGPLSGEAEPEKTQQVLAIPGPSSGDTEGNERGGGLDTGFAPLALSSHRPFSSPPRLPRQELIFPFLLQLFLLLYSG